MLCWLEMIVTRTTKSFVMILDQSLVGVIFSNNSDVGAFIMWCQQKGLGGERITMGEKKGGYNQSITLQALQI